MTLNSPTQLEWIFVLAPLVLALVAAFFIERASGKIHNVLVAIILAGLLAARMLIGPGPLGMYLLSPVLVAAIAIGLGWGRGYLGGGTAKLAVAVSCAFTPFAAVAIAAALVLTIPLLVLTRRLDPEKLSGSGTILVLCTIAITGLTLFGQAIPS